MDFVALSNLKKLHERGCNQSAKLCGLEFIICNSQTRREGSLLVKKRVGACLLDHSLTHRVGSELLSLLFYGENQIVGVEQALKPSRHFIPHFYTCFFLFWI